MTQFPPPPPVPPSGGNTPPPVPPVPPGAGQGYGVPPPYMPPQPMYAAPPQQDSTFGGLIPLNNPRALASYYLGIFSLFPLLGLFMGFAAVYLGMQGLKFADQNPTAKGKTHAWIGIVCGGIFGFIWLAVTVLTIIALITTRSHGD